jgi:hypothetical protein
MSTNCERCRDLGAVQLAEATSSYSTSAVSCCAHSEQLNMSRSQPGVPVRAMSYSRIARPQLGHAGVLPTGCSGDLNKLNWGIAPLHALPTNSQQRNLFRDWFCHGSALVQKRARFQARWRAKASSSFSVTEECDLMSTGGPQGAVWSAISELTSRQALWSTISGVRSA